MFSTESVGYSKPDVQVGSVLFSAGESTMFNLSYEDLGNDTVPENATFEFPSKSVPHPDVPLPNTVLLGIAIYLTVVGILATFGNVLFILTVIRWRYLRNNSHMLLLLNMAAADLAISITGYPYTTISGYVGEWIFGSLMCQLYAFLCFTFSQVSMNTLVAVSVFRYIAICHPHMKHFLTTRTSVWALAIVWCHALFWTTAPLVGWSSYTFEPTRISCSINWNNRDPNGVSYVIGTTVFCYLSHIAILIWCYKRIFHRVTHLQSKSRIEDISFGRRRRPARNITRSTVDSNLSRSTTEIETPASAPRQVPSSDRFGEMEDDPPDSPPSLPRCQSLIVFSFTTGNLSEMELHVLGMNIAMVLAFVTFWTPYAIVSLISAFYENLSPIWYIFPTIFAKTSCMINPILYGLTNSFLRKQFLLYLRGFLRLTTEIENFEVMRQRQQDGLYNKEGIFMGKKGGVGAVTHCVCDGCIASRRQMKLLIEQQQQRARSSAGVSPAVSSIIVAVANKGDEDIKVSVLPNGGGSSSKEDNDENGEKSSTLKRNVSSANELEDVGLKITGGEAEEWDEKERDLQPPPPPPATVVVTITAPPESHHQIQSNSIILNVNTLPEEVGG